MMCCDRAQKFWPFLVHLVPVAANEDMICAGLHPNTNLSDVAEAAPGMGLDGCQPGIAIVCSNTPNITWSTGSIERAMLNAKSAAVGKRNRAGDRKGSKWIERFHCGGPSCLVNRAECRQR